MMDAYASTDVRADVAARATSSSPWRGLTWKRVGLAAAAGLVIGLMQGVGDALRANGTWWVIVGEAALPVAAYAVFLLLALTVAANAEVQRVPRWLPFALAAVVSTALAVAADMFSGWLLRALAGQAEASEPMFVAMYAWQMIPQNLMLATFAAFGTIQAVDAQRRMNAVRTVRLERTRVAREAYEARLSALQARVEPAFLFETLSDVERLYESDPALGAQVLDDLIVFLRAALPAIEEPSSTLGAEFTLAQTWLDIMRIRSGERLTFAIADLGPEREARMPPMVLLPLVQQAAGTNRAGERAVLLSTAVEGGRLRIAVTGPDLAFAPSANTPAVEAIRECLAALYGDAATLELKAASHDRSQALLEIPHERTDRGHR